MSIKNHQNNAITRQRGVTLIVALVMLLILTLVGISTMTDSTLQERLSSNSQQRVLARVNAQAALVAGEALLEDMNITNKNQLRDAFTDITVNPADKTGLYIAIATDSEVSDINLPPPNSNLAVATNWGAVASREVVVDDFLNSRYIIEYIGVAVTDEISGGENPSLNVGSQKNDDAYPLAFRITAIGYGATNDNPAILQTIYHTQQSEP